MSSLRLALKQSLQETGHLVPKEKKKRRQETKRDKKPRDASRPRKRGRPPKRRPEQQQQEEEPAVAKADKRPFVEDNEKEEEAGFSSENEFSYDSEEEEEEEEESEEEEDDHEEEVEEEDTTERQDKKTEKEQEEDRGNDGEPTESNHNHTIPPDTNESSSSNLKESSSKEEPDSEEERRRQRKILKKKLKNSAANKIQSQWKKRKNRTSEPEETSKPEPVEATKSSTTTTTTTNTTTSQKGESQETDTSDKGGNKQESADANDTPTAATAVQPEKKKRKPGTVPPPSHDILEWSQRLTEKKSRKNISKGMRVKVRFATKVRREGKIVKKRKWYGGRVSNVTLDGSKIKIKYDDGTSEISQFPDDDVVVDDTDNGQHSQTASALVHRFLPPQARSPTPTPPAAVDDAEEKPPVKEDKAKEEPPTAKVTEPTKEAKPKETAESIPEEKPQEKEQQEEEKQEEGEEKPKPKEGAKKEETKVEVTQEKKKKPPTPVPEEPKPSTTETLESDDAKAQKPRSSPITVDTAKKSEEQTMAKPMETDDEPTPSDETVKPKASKEEVPETAKEEETAKQEETPKPNTISSPPKELEAKPKPQKVEQPEVKVSKPTLTIRISKAKVQEKADKQHPPETPKPKSGGGTYSSDEELDANTPVTERKVKSLKVKRKRVSEDLSTRPKKRKLEVVKEKEDKTEEPTTEKEKPKKSKIITIPLKQPVEVPELPSLTKSSKKRKDSPVSRSGRKSPTTQRSNSDSPLPMSQDLTKQNNETTMVKPVTKKAVKQEVDNAEDNLAMPSTEKAAIGSKGSAFGKKPKAGPEEKPKDPERIKPGRKAAQEAKEKMGPKPPPQQQQPDDLYKKKKKRRRKDGNSDEDESDDEERQWVQCDKCQKWRILPSRMEASSLPDFWECSMNTWDPKHADCSVAEQTLKQIQKERRRAKKRAKQQQRLEALETTERDPKPRGTKSAQNSPRPNKPVVKVGKNTDLESKRASPLPSSTSIESGPDPKEKRGRKGKKEKDEAKQSEAQRAVAAAEVTPKKPGRKRGRPARNHAVETPRTSESKDDDNVEWVQCEKCEKWRKLPPYMSADELPDSWYCSLNTWNEASASCDAPEDQADAHHQEVGVFGNMPQGHVGKYSYRSMIYGSGRKYNRPMSEKARAAESLYQRPQIEEGIPQTSVMYAKSSMFVPRMSNFQKTQIVEEKKTSIFDVLADSDLWTELQGVGHAMQVLSNNNNFSGNQTPSFLTYDSLPENIKEQMRQVVLQVLGVYVLSGDELVEEALRFPWESLSADLAHIRTYINTDVVINTLLSLVRDGEVQMTCFKDMSVPMTEWIPRYRRVIRSSPKNLEAHESLKASKCMKISKPWKQMDDSDGWITGGQ